jgi:hypothetical protein
MIAVKRVLEWIGAGGGAVLEGVAEPFGGEGPTAAPWAFRGAMWI